MLHIIIIIGLTSVFPCKARLDHAVGPLLFISFVSRNVHVFRLAYITYIRPLLEYVNKYGLLLIMSINRLKRVQQHFTKQITELSDLSYQKCLMVFNLDTSEHRPHVT